MIFRDKVILVLAPHIDDGEFGCGGTIRRCIEEGCQVHYVAFSDCRTSLPESAEPTILRKELREASTELGISESNVKVLDFEVRTFPDSRQEILQYLVNLKQQLHPEIIFTPCTMDIHQDHQVISQESIRAFKTKTILGYELPWNNLTLPSNCLVKLTDVQVDYKIKAIECYNSQTHRGYHNEEYIRSLARTRGVRIGVQYAEAFELIRLSI